MVAKLFTEYLMQLHFQTLNNFCFKGSHAVINAGKQMD
jgi:hypothetical protein